MPAYRRPSTSRLIGALLLLAAGGLIGGCLLSTRDDEGGGETPPPTIWVPPVALGNALGNIQRSLENGVLTNYGNSFNENQFELELDPADISELGQNEFESWSAVQEEQRMTGILGGSPAELKVFWVPADSLEESANVRYYRDLAYRLEFTEPTRSVTYSGLVDLWFEDDGTGEWYIIRWVDKRDGSPNRTWGWLRARNQVEF